MKLIKLIGLFILICFTFFYTEKIIDVTNDQDEIMIKIKESKSILPIDAKINGNTIIPGVLGKNIDIDASYKNMKKYGYFNESLLIYTNIIPNISIYNNYDKYIIKGNNQDLEVSIIYILNKFTLDNTLNTIKNNNNYLNFFIDSNYLFNNINVIDKLKDYEIYNYGNNGIYTKDNLIITNNIINNKSNNLANFCLFIKEDSESLKNCANNKMLSIKPVIIKSLIDLKNNLDNNNLFLIDNTKYLDNILEYLNSKGYKTIPLSELIREK